MSNFNPTRLAPQCCAQECWGFQSGIFSLCACARVNMLGERERAACSTNSFPVPARGKRGEPSRRIRVLRKMGQEPHDLPSQNGASGREIPKRKRKTSLKYDSVSGNDKCPGRKSMLYRRRETTNYPRAQMEQEMSRFCPLASNPKGSEKTSRKKKKRNRCS